MSRTRRLLTRLLESSNDINLVAQLHSLVLRCGVLTAADCFFVTRLVSSYAKFNSTSLACKLFDEIRHPNSFLWNAVLRAQCRAQDWIQTLQHFRRMASKPYNLDTYTLPIALKACSALAALHHGRLIHNFVVTRNRAYASDKYVATALVEMYAQCGEMGSAIQVFEGISEPDVILWTSVVSGYQQNGYPEQAVSFFSRMVEKNGVVPNAVTLVSLVSALMQLGDLRGGRCCHGFLVRMGFSHDLSLVNSLLNFYAKMGAVRTARMLFETMLKRDVISWSCILSCYAHNGAPIAALEVYRKMVEMGVEPNAVTITSALQACSLASDLQEGMRLHQFAIQNGFDLEKSVTTSLIDMYMNCSHCKEAIGLFYRMPKKDVVAWAATIDGCVKNGFANASLKLFKAMLLDKVNPDAVIMVKVIIACSRIGLLSQAHCLHGFLIRCGFTDNFFVGASLVNLYSKCGSLDDAVGVFESMPEKDVVLWSSSIACYGMNGQGNKAIRTFEHMIESSIKPNSITFVAVLTACSHRGMVEEGRRIFESMNLVHGVTPNWTHYCIMVDLLSRTGKLHEALKLVDEMPKPVHPHVLCALLSGYRSHQDLEMGEMVAQRLLEIDPCHVGYYNLLVNMYAQGGKWNDVEAVKEVIKERGLRKTPAYSTVERRCMG
ncbi:hypothetical protein HPP92_000779 [Vanilla planifolia]|uniref:Pentatricopeptide repeat-containing protein n=1 Tax=Vanilla planifolia TaxID=51239 RepID=A0A835VJ33_VANPL|nr:hypothetical protein HPP92_000779 [Vanilla planifolia]